ncbi:amidohydrolase family protein [Rhodopila sp.]|jgi:predicted TIM-barrel fold metal-dependent hydrolase|uniref:amidohydrolase family protein n=1 Tax=Rhodopila sp. TaxID=2480087 RepID=UPI002C655937|nr:amidohydrolase family protein [Rhodopila sp.]HVZ09572.1 amidohydrolase family protein [Rhodopila sp.]
MTQIPEAKGPYRGTNVRDDAALAAWLKKRPREAALEPALPIIDPHHHFWDSPHRGHYLLPELLDDIGGGHNIVSTVFLECRAMYRKDGPREMAALGEVEFVAGLAAMSASGGYGPCRVAEVIIGGGDLSVGARVRELLEAEIIAAGGRLRGMRHGVAWDSHEEIYKYASRTVPLHQVMDPKFREGMAQLAPLGLSFESWQYHPQLPDAIDLARSFPDTTIILNHVGGVLGVGPYAGRRQEEFARWRRDIQELAKLPNVYCKLGGLGMVSCGFDFHERDAPPSSEDLANAWRMYIEPCIEAFGASRCMFESNFPPDKQSCGYTELWNAFKRITASASADEKKALYSGTAARVYRMIDPG